MNFPEAVSTYEGVFVSVLETVLFVSVLLEHTNTVHDLSQTLAVANIART